jgi:peptide/nickel transport system substrate-binding protein
MVVMVLKASRVSFILPLVVVANLLLAACGPSAAPPSSQPVEATPTPAEQSARGTGGTLRLLYWQAPTILNPHLAQGAKDWAACRVTYEPLASYDKDGNLIPFLAAEIPSLENGDVARDGESVTWKLKKGVKWSDGEPFTADDVLFTYEFISDPATRATTTSNYSAVKSVEVIDPFTVRVNFKDVNPAWSLPFVGVQGMIIPRHMFEGYNGSNASEAPANLQPVGTGPYRVSKFKPEEILFLGNQLIETNKIVYELNSYFREADKPFFSRVELKGGGTTSEAARSVLQLGNVDFAYNLQVDATELAKLEAGGKGQGIAPLGQYVEWIVLNQTDPNRPTADGERSSLQFPHPFFSDKKMRQAFSYAIDREAIAALYGPTGRPTSNMLVSPSTYESPNTSYEFNPDKAAALLDEAGWGDTDGDRIRDKDGVKMSVVFQTSVNPLRQQTQQIVKKDLEAIGVEVELKIIDASNFFGSDPADPKTRLHFYADLQEYATGNRSPDPGEYMKWWTCDEIAQKSNNWSGRNDGRWCNPAYDALYKQSTTEMDPAKRRELFIQMNDMIIGDVALIPLVHRADVNGVGNTLQGVEFTPWDAELWNIKDWRRTSP